MKRTWILLLLLSVPASIPLGGQPNNLIQQSGAPSQVMAAFTGGSVWTSGTSGTCIWFFPIFGNLTLSDLFAPGPAGSLAIDKEHAYFIWVSDWNIQAMAQNSGFGGSAVSLAVLPAGTATIYYSPDPITRDWSDYSLRSTWGVPVATFVRGGGLFQSPDGFQLTDKFYFSAQLVNSKNVQLHGRRFDVRDLIPHGMTCFEYGQVYSSTETGSCMAMNQ